MENKLFSTQSNLGGQCKEDVIFPPFGTNIWVLILIPQDDNKHAYDDELYIAYTIYCAHSAQIKNFFVSFFAEYFAS